MSWPYEACVAHTRTGHTCDCGRVIYGNAFKRHAYSCWVWRRAQDWRDRIDEAVREEWERAREFEDGVEECLALEGVEYRRRVDRYSWRWCRRVLDSYPYLNKLEVPYYAF